MNLHKRIEKLELRPTGYQDGLRDRLIRAKLRVYADEVAAGTRKPEDATETAVIAELDRPRPKMVGGLVERLRAAKKRYEENVYA